MHNDIGQMVMSFIPLLMMKDLTLQSILIFAITFIISMLSNGKNQFSNPLTFFKKKKPFYTLKMSITYKNNLYYSSCIPLGFEAVMDDLYHKIIKNQNSKTKYKIIEEDLYPKIMKIVKFESKNTIYKITDEIEVIQEYNTSNSEKDNYTYDKYELHLSGKDDDMRNVMSYIDQVVRKYDENQILKLNDMKTYVLNGFDKEESSFAMFDVVDFNTSKNFDNMFFDDKHKLLDRVDFFEQNELHYKRLGIPYTLGFLFHGQPGTGKTSAIKALAKYTKRHIVILPVKHIDSIEKLKKIFMSPRINGIQVPTNRRLYVFEEIDCSEWAPMVTSRNLSVSNDDNEIKKEKATITEVINIMASITNDDTKKEKKKKGNDLHLGDFLELLDGIVEIPGRMIVMTSNYPERLDKALLRPGRIDMMIEFKKLKREDVYRMYKLWFDEEIEQEEQLKISDVKFTQAELGNIFSEYRDNISIIRALQS